MNYEDLFLQNLPLIERIIASLCRRKCVFGVEADDFRSYVMEKLIENDYRILRRFQGKSSLSTYLTTVIGNLFRDFLIQKRGRWRPSAIAQRLGPQAVKLETLLVRDGIPFGQAVQILRTNLEVELSEEELDEIAGKLPSRVPRQFEGGERVNELATESDADSRIEDGERRDKAVRAGEALAKALAELSAEDRLIVRMEFQDSFRIVEIARALHLDQRGLYRRREKTLGRLKEVLETEGLTYEDVRDILGWSGLDLEVDYGDPEDDDEDDQDPDDE